jgi:N-acetylneuraminic acid mutarotase
MYVLGGHIDDIAANVLKFDSTQGTWIEVARFSFSRFATTACAFGNDIYVFGGGPGENCTMVFKFDTVGNEWFAQSSMPAKCCDHSAVVLNGLVLHRGSWR